mgnify:CR=1 FL=1
MGGSLSSRPFYGVCRRVRGCSPGTGSIPGCSTRPKIHTKERKSIMGKNIAKLVVKMKSKSLIDIETMGDGASQVFMAAAAVAHTVADSGKGNRKKAEAIMTVAKDIIDSVFEAAWKSEYGEAPAAEPVATAATAEKRNDPSASQPGNMDSMMEKIVADAMKQAKENPGQAQGVMFKVPAGDMPMEEVVKHIISAVDKQARKDKNGG